MNFKICLNEMGREYTEIKMCVGALRPLLCPTVAWFLLSSVFSEWIKNNHQNIIGSKIYGGKTDKIERSGEFSG